MKGVASERTVERAEKGAWFIQRHLPERVIHVDYSEDTLAMEVSYDVIAGRDEVVLSLDVAIEITRVET